ncbi:hypothetical protein ONV78_25970 [Hahella sp. CR1]|uniref:hypothetical protein n=1 Tax=Hahella sp. CR1 TaxID=2992807 RepID=UPI0024416D9A|nr:hypothetical protein [Hahella sp. CR1]MDG9671214.1 hypothetical protein [Hahella sp. CR1]
MSPQIIARARQLSAWFHAFLCGLFLIPFFAYGLFTSSEDILPASKMLLVDWGPIILGSMALAYVYGKLLGHWYLPLEKKRSTFVKLLTSCVVSFLTAVSFNLLAEVAGVIALKSVESGLGIALLGMVGGSLIVVKLLPLIAPLGGLGGWLVMKHCAKLIEQESNEVS